MRVLLPVTVVSAIALAAALGALPALGGDKDKDPTVRDLSDYRLRVGDHIAIVVYNGNKLKEELPREDIAVPGNGDVSFPPIGKIHLLDRTVFEIEETIAQKLKDENFLATPNVGVVVTQYEPRTVFLMGAATGTVTLPIHKNLRILEVLATAGKLGAQGADFTRVRVRRVGADGRPFSFAVNVDDILDRNMEEQDIVVFENDIIIVPKLEQMTPQSADWVYVLGKVGTPGRQPLIKGRTPFTITKLIAMCGDFQEFADRTKVKVIRTTPTGRDPYVIDFDDIIEGKRPDFELQPDDLIYVPETWI